MKNILYAGLCIALLPLGIVCAGIGFVARMAAGGLVAGWQAGEKLTEWVHS